MKYAIFLLTLAPMLVMGGSPEVNNGRVVGSGEYYYKAGDMCFKYEEVVTEKGNTTTYEMTMKRVPMEYCE